MKFEITPSVHWVGKIDWELRKFHGEEYSTHRGSPETTTSPPARFTAQ